MSKSKSENGLNLRATTGLTPLESASMGGANNPPGGGHPGNVGGAASVLSHMETHALATTQHNRQMDVSKHRYNALFIIYTSFTISFSQKDRNNSRFNLMVGVSERELVRFENIFVRVGIIILELK